MSASRGASARTEYVPPTGTDASGAQRFGGSMTCDGTYPQTGENAFPSRSPGVGGSHLTANKPNA